MDTTPVAGSAARDTVTRTGDQSGGRLRAALRRIARSIGGLFGYATQFAEYCRYHLAECRDVPDGTEEV